MSKTILLYFKVLCNVILLSSFDTCSSGSQTLKLLSGSTPVNPFPVITSLYNIAHQWFYNFKFIVIVNKAITQKINKKATSTFKEFYNTFRDLLKKNLDNRSRIFLVFNSHISMPYFKLHFWLLCVYEKLRGGCVVSFLNKLVYPRLQKTS